MRKTLLITGIGGDIGQSIARIVRDVRPGWRILGVDVHARHAGSLVADACEEVAYASDPSYPADLARIVDEHRVDLCLPTSEAEIAVLAGMEADRIGTALVVGICRPVVEVGMDKLATAEFIRSLGLPAPWTLPASVDSLPESYPCIYKPRRAAGSKGVVLCQDRVEAGLLAERTQAAVFQEYLEPADKEVTCAVFRDRRGTTTVLPMLRQLAGGLTAWAQVIDAPEAVCQCKALADALELRGPMNVQMRITAHGPRIFEINPRLSSTVYMRHLMGFQDLRWLLDDAEGLSNDYPVIQPGLTSVRVQAAELLSLAPGAT